jgi:hypothetical protein
MTTFTRAQYLNDECTHEQYYGQFVTGHLTDAVVNLIGLDRIKASSDPYLNDIPLKAWDNLQPLVMSFAGAAIGKANGSGGVALSDCVCTAKAAARYAKAHWSETK